MQTLELKPLKNKLLKVILVESEFPIEWALESPSITENIFANLSFLSREYLHFIENLVKKYKPDFVVEDRGMRSFDKSYYEDQFISLFTRYNIPYEIVDIPEHALNYLSVALNEKKALVDDFTLEIEKIRAKGDINPNDTRFQQLLVWREYIWENYKKAEEEIRYKVREAWMLMGILDIAKDHEKKKIKSLFICDQRHFNGIAPLAEDLGIELEIINIKKVAKDIDKKTSIAEIINSSSLEIMPIKIKKKAKEEKILYFFDTDDYASPFDINMAYDAGFDVVIPLCEIKADKVTQLVQDAMFSRKPKAPTVYFIGGSDVKECEKIGEKVLGALVPPFESPVIMDPRGSHTTAAALVIKTLEVAGTHGMPDLSGKKVVILGGTGPVGQISALIASKLHCNTIIISRREKAVKELAKNLSIKAGKDGSEIFGKAATTEEERFEIVKDADVIWSVGKAGIQMLSKESMEKLTPNKIVVDINLVPPYGIEGLKPKHNNEEIYKGVYGIGALDIGRLKYKVESKIFKDATNTKGKKLFDYNYAFQIGTRLLLGQTIEIIQ